MNLNRSFWKGRRVFLTGHTGFKGSWLSLWLHSLDAEVTGYALDPPTEPNLFTQARVEGCLHSLRGDIRDYPALKKAIAECRPEVILHMAAQSVVRTSYENPIENYETNVMGTVHVLEAARQLGTPCVIVNVTSDKCYENREWMWGYRENETMGGKDPYSNSKACAELVTSAYRDSFFPPENIEKHGVAIGSARAGNAIGGGDWTAHQLIPDLIRAFMAGEPCQIRNPASYRPWQFTLEALRGYLMLAERLSKDASTFATGWNFGPVDSDVQPVSWIADTLVRLWGHGASWKLDGRANPHEARALKLDATKAGALLHWRPALPLAEALGWIVEWYRGLEQGGNMRNLTLAQIHRYEALIGMEKP
ncbi:MAG: CDP-glucose 4,6-dehydratase [Edaphobacter sp.]